MRHRITTVSGARLYYEDRIGRWYWYRLRDGAVSEPYGAQTSAENARAKGKIIWKGGVEDGEEMADQ